MSSKEELQKWFERLSSHFPFPEHCWWMEDRDKEIREIYECVLALWKSLKQAQAQIPPGSFQFIATQITTLGNIIRTIFAHVKQKHPPDKEHQEHYAALMNKTFHALMRELGKLQLIEGKEEKLRVEAASILADILKSTHIQPYRKVFLLLEADVKTLPTDWNKKKQKPAYIFLGKLAEFFYHDLLQPKVSDWEIWSVGQFFYHWLNNLSPREVYGLQSYDVAKQFALYLNEKLKERKILFGVAVIRPGYPVDMDVHSFFEGYIVEPRVRNVHSFIVFEVNQYDKIVELVKKGSISWVRNEKDYWE